MTAAELAVAFAVVTAGALVQGSIGFGLALVAAPVLTLIDPMLVPGPLLVAGVPLSLMIGWREWDHLELRGLRWPVAGQLVGTFGAVWVLGVSSPRSIALVLGACVLAAVALSLFGLSARPTPRNLVAGGTLAGFMGTTASIPGPPLALIHQHVGAARLRATLVPFFLVGSALSIAALALAGRLGAPELGAALVLLPGVVAGFLVSNLVGRGLDEGRVRAAVLLLSTLAALGVIYRAW